MNKVSAHPGNFFNAAFRRRIECFVCLFESQGLRLKTSQESKVPRKILIQANCNVEKFVCFGIFAKRKFLAKLIKGIGIVQRPFADRQDLSGSVMNVRAIHCCAPGRSFAVFMCVLPLR